jgi:hypothetical protein
MTTNNRRFPAEWEKHKECYCVFRTVRIGGKYEAIQWAFVTY